LPGCPPDLARASYVGSSENESLVGSLDSEMGMREISRFELSTKANSKRSVFSEPGDGEVQVLETYVPNWQFGGRDGMV